MNRPCSTAIFDHIPGAEQSAGLDKFRARSNKYTKRDPDGTMAQLKVDLGEPTFRRAAHKGSVAGNHAQGLKTFAPT